MPLHEDVVGEPPQGVMAEAATMLPAEPERPGVRDEAAQPAAQDYEYIRQDGTVEYAANREEAIKLCPVLGKLAVQDSEAANLLLDIASIGQAKLAEKAERPKPETPKQTEPTVKLIEPVEQAKIQTSEKASEAVRSETAVRTYIDHQERRAHEAAILETVTSTDPKPVTESGKIIPGQTEPEQDSPQKRPSPAQPHAIAESRLTHEQLEHEAGQVIMPIKVVAATKLAEPQLDVIQTARQTPTDEMQTIGRVVEPAKQGPQASQEDVEQALPTVVDVTSEKLDRESLRIYEDFRDALALVIAPSSEQLMSETEANTVTGENEPRDIDEAQEAEPLPVIAVTVSARLNELAAGDRETIVPVLAEIVETIRVIEALKSEDAELEVVEIVQMGLEDLVVTLFERLGIEYEAADVEQFVAVLLRPTFQPPEPEIKELTIPDLEHDGTHEAKFYSASTAAGFFTEAEHGLERLLGTFVLLSAIARHAA
jgi:hypothetical protein